MLIAKHKGRGVHMRASMDFFRQRCHRQSWRHYFRDFGRGSCQPPSRSDHRAVISMVVLPAASKFYVRSRRRGRKKQPLTIPHTCEGEMYGKPLQLRLDGEERGYATLRTKALEGSAAMERKPQIILCTIFGVKGCVSCFSCKIRNGEGNAGACKDGAGPIPEAY